MKKLILLATGGTIASVAGENGLTPGISGAELLEKVNLPGVEITCRDVFALDSSNVQPEEWRVLAAAAFRAAQEADGVVITHGTDTMAYSAAALSFMLHGLRVPVVFTGSQLPMGHLLSDAPVNLAEAVETARTAPPGVYITFNHKIIRGCRAVKMRTTSFDAFDSINEAPAGYLDSEGAHYRTVPMREPMGQPELLDQLETRSMFFTAISREVADMALEDLAKGWFDGLDMQILSRETVKYQCDCSREKMEKALIAMGRKDLQQLMEEDGGAELTCHFCRAAHRFSKEDLQHLLERTSQ